MVLIVLFDELSELWLLDYKTSVKQRSYIDAKHHIKNHFIPVFSGEDIESITSKDIVSFIRQKKQDASVNMALRSLSILERMYAYAYIHRITMHDPTHRVKKYLNLRTPRNTKPFLILSDLHLYFDTALREPCRVEIGIVYYVMVFTVVRLSELVQAKVSDFDFENGLWYIPEENTKMYREHIVIMPTQLAYALRKYFEWHNSEWAFPHFKDHSKPCKRHTIQDRNNKGGRGRKVLGLHTPHAFRNTFSTYANEEGWNKDYIEVTLAHRTLDIRYIYNKALYLRQRKLMMQWYADEVDKHIDFRKYEVLKKFLIIKE